MSGSASGWITRGGLSRLLILVLALGNVVVGSAPDLIQRRVSQLTAPVGWSVVDWESRHLPDALDEIALQVLRPSPDAEVLERTRAFLDGALTPELAGNEAVRNLLVEAVALELRAHGAPTIGPTVMPPVTLSLTRPLRLLVVSPRDEIRQSHFSLLDDRFQMGDADRLEAAVEQSNVSALVVDQIAIATYPTLIPTSTPPESALETVAHEWTHIALYLRPLGRAYGSSPQARAINETTADTVGEEIGNALMERVGVEPPSRAVGSRASDFAERMRAIRQQVDVLLARGQITEAEAYMEQQRQLLVADGYRIRKLNQAYFAFFGNYAEGPAASTEVPDAIRTLRRRSDSLAEFLDRMGTLTTIDDLRAAIR